MLPNYRTTTNFREIAKIIAHPKNYKNSILWQSTVSNRYIFDIEDIQVNERFMSFSTKLGGKMLPFFNQLNQTYCKVPYRETVFKVSIINIVDNTVTFNLPSDVKTLELRENPRQKFRPSEGKYITVQVRSELVSGATQALKFQVIDLSESGVSIVVSDKNAKYFEANFNFDVLTLMDVELEPKISMELIYSQQFKFKQKGRVVSAYRIGFKFKEPLSTEQLSIFF